MYRRFIPFFVVAASATVSGQSSAEEIAGRMMARLRVVQWEDAPANTCAKWIPYQMAIHATEQWTHHCVSTSRGVIEESFYYLFEGSQPARLRVDLRPEDESPELNIELERLLAARLTKSLGAVDPEPEMMEIGFRRLRYGQPVAGQNWRSGHLHYFLHRNQSNQMPMGMRKGVELIVFEDRLMQERAKDKLIEQVDGLGTTGPETPFKVEQAFELLRQSESAPRERKAQLLLDANRLVARAAALLSDRDAAPVRRRLAAYGVKLGAETHYGGLDYRQDLLWRVWREFPDTDAGEAAFVELQNRGWNTDTRPGCPTNPDLFREVIEKGEAFVAAHPNSRFRKEVLFSVAVANESWWSIAHAPANDGWVADIPYPRAAVNKQQAPQAREHAIRYYRQVIELAPESAEAASARRRLPRIEAGFDTGQRRFFCSYC